MGPFEAVVGAQLVVYMESNNLSRVVIWGYKNTHTHRFIHEAVFLSFKALLLAAQSSIPVVWLTGRESNLTAKSLVVSTLAMQSVILGRLPAFESSHYMLLVRCMHRTCLLLA